jgi:hypothetical protein
MITLFISFVYPYPYLGSVQHVLHVETGRFGSYFYDWPPHHYLQPINVPTAGAHPQGERAITHHAGPVRIGGC